MRLVLRDGTNQRHLGPHLEKTTPKSTQPSLVGGCHERISSRSHCRNYAMLPNEQIALSVLDGLE